MQNNSRFWDKIFSKANGALSHGAYDLFRNTYENYLILSYNFVFNNTNKGFKFESMVYK